MRNYYQLIKPGIVYGNAMTALAAFAFASTHHVSIPLLFAMVAGLSFSIASACVLNNVIDRDIDPRMERTKDRAIPTGQVSVRNALVFAFVLGIAGIATLYFFTNLWALGVTLFGVVMYVCAYTPAKRITRHSTIIGALAGAVPPVVGYVAVTNALDTTAILLFLILVSWQMTHFFAIALFRLEDYRNANLPVMPVYAGIPRTKTLMLLYAFVFAYAVYALGYIHHLSLWFMGVMGILSLGWIALGCVAWHIKDDSRWARLMFFYSLILLVAFSIALALS